MCLAIYKPANISIPLANLRNGFSNNSHGAGFAVRQDDDTVLICKGFFDVDQFLEQYKRISENQTRQALIHFRWATHGETNAFNCHPWALGESKMVTIEGVPHAEIAPAAMIHNGVLQHRSDKERSDTGYYVFDILDPLYRKFPGFIGDSVMSHLIAEDIGAYNKFAIMNGDGACSIVNYKAGTNEDGVWYSNCDFRSSRYWGGRADWDDEDLVHRYSGWGGRKSIAAEAADEGLDHPGSAGDDAAGSDVDLALFPGETLMPEEETALLRLAQLFPSVVAQHKSAEDVFAFFKGARASYRRSNPESAKLSQPEIDQLMHSEGYVDALVEAGVARILAS